MAVDPIKSFVAGLTEPAADGGQLYRSVLAAMAEGVLLVDSGGRVIDSNPAARRILGLQGDVFPTDTRITGHAWRVRDEGGTPVPDGQTPAAVALRTGLPQRDVVLELVRPDQTSIWVSVNAEPIVEPGVSRSTAVVVSFSDVTGFKRTTAALQLRLEEQESVHRLSDAVAGATSLDEVYDIALTGVQRGARADRAAVLLVDADGVMRFKAWRGLSAAYRAAAEGHSPWTADSQNPVPVMIPDTGADQSLGALRGPVLAEGIGALGFIPLIAGTRLIGKFMIYFDGLHQFEEREVRFLQTMSSHLGVAVQRKQSEDALRRREEQFRQLVEVASDVIYRVDDRGRFQYLSPAALALVEAGGPAMVGRRFINLVKPEHRRAVTGFYLDQFRNGVRSSYREFPIVTRSGREFWLGQHVQLVERDGRFVGFQAIARDVTQRRLAEDALRESEERFRQLTETIEDVFWLEDTLNDEVIYLSPSFERTWGIPRETIYRNRRAWLETVDLADRARVAAAHDRLEGGEDEVEFQIVRPDGSKRWIRSRAYPLRTRDGTIYRVAGIATDVTSRRQLEEQLRQSQKMEVVGQLAGGIAHDFNNLLTVIQGNASLLLSEPDLRVDARAELSEIAVAADRAANLTRQLLTFGRRQLPSARSIDLVEAVASMVQLLHRVLGEDVVLETRFAEVPVVQADPGMIEQIVMNLALNARDSMPAGGRLALGLDGVTISPADLDDHPGGSIGAFARISVSDSGMGIPHAVMPHIFEPFFTTKEIGKGTGLGLATVFGIVEQHRGWIEVDSRVGRGTTFQVFLPAAEHAVPGSGPAATSPGVAPRGSETILLVEDEPAVRRLARTVLERYGYRVIEAESGPAALAAWEAVGPTVDLLLVDLVMPGGMSGRDLAIVLTDRRPDLRVLYATGYSHEVVTRRFNFTVGRDFLQKPYGPKDLAAAVRSCLDHPRVAAG